MKIAVTGSSGLIGSALVSLLSAEGHAVVRFVRSTKEISPSSVYWNPDEGKVDPYSLEKLDAVVHLAGESIAQRWTNEAKSLILYSRVQPTRTLSVALSHLEHPPKVFISASAIGYYGNRGDERLHEGSTSGTSGFLPQVCREWEAATESAQKKGLRVVNMRFGVVLSKKGGALAKMLPPFRMGLGGIVGDGKQWLSWIAIDDVAGAIYHTITTESLRGAVNCVAPNPVTNREFTKTLGNVLGRPTIFPLPAFAARKMFGQMADELLLSSARVEPRWLMESQYLYRFRDLEPALRFLLGK